MAKANNYNQVAMITVVIFIGLVVAAEAAFTCGTMAQSLAPCIDYLRSGGGGAVPPGCCAGIKTLNTAAKTTPDRQTACKCLKQAANVMPTAVKLALTLPSKCGVNIPYKLDPSTDCSKVH